MDLQIRGFGTMAIGGQERPFHLGTYQARVFCEHQKLELDAYREAVSGIGSGEGLKNSVLIEVLLYSALAAGAKFKKLPVDFDADDVSFWLAGAPAEEVSKLFAVAFELAKTAPDPGNGAGQPAPTAQK